MFETGKPKLGCAEPQCISLGITPDGAPRNIISIPWETTAHAFNMIMPDLYLSPEELQNQEIMENLRRHRIIGCYIWAPLQDFGFISHFHDVMDINIQAGDHMVDLDFLKDLKECRMLYLRNAKLKNLDVIIDAKKCGTSLFAPFKCVGLYDCQVEDISRFGTEKVHFSEFLIWSDQGDAERNRWRMVSANTWRYYQHD